MRAAANSEPPSDLWTTAWGVTWQQRTWAHTISSGDLVTIDGTTGGIRLGGDPEAEDAEAADELAILAEALPELLRLEEWGRGREDPDTHLYVAVDSPSDTIGNSLISKPAPIRRQSGTTSRAFPCSAA